MVNFSVVKSDSEVFPFVSLVEYENNISIQ